MKHDQVIELLPWFLNGTLAADEQHSIEAHLEHCEECGRQLSEFRALSDAAAELSDETPEEPEGLFARVLADIDGLEAEARAPAAATATSSGLLTRALRGLEAWWEPLTRPTRLALATQSLALIATLGLLVTLWSPTGSLQTLSGPEGVAMSDQAHLIVGFHDGVAELELRELLVELDGQIVHGPSSIGLYTIELSFPRREQARLAALIATLRERSELLRFVEPAR